MADLPTRNQLENAFMRAHELGNRDHAQMFARALKAGQYSDANPTLKADAQGLDRGASDGPFGAFGRTGVGVAARSLASGVNDFMSGISETAADAARAYGDLDHAFAGAFPGSEEGADEIAMALSNTSTMYQERADALSPLAEGVRTFDNPQAFAVTAGRTIGRMLPGVATGNPVAGAAAIGADVYGAELRAGKEMGLDEAGARKRAGLLAGLELVTERLPLEAILRAKNAPGVRGGIDKILRAAGLEALQEEIVTVVQLTYDAGITDQDYTAGSVGYQIAESVALGATAGGVLATPSAFSPAPPEAGQPDDDDPGESNDDVARGVEAETGADGVQSDPRTRLAELGLDTSNLDQQENDDGQQRSPEEGEPRSDQPDALGPAQQQSDGAQPGGRIDPILGPPEQQPDDDAFAPGAGQPDQLDGSGQSDGQSDAEPDAERGPGAEPSAPEQGEGQLDGGPGGLPGALAPLDGGWGSPLGDPGPEPPSYLTLIRPVDVEGKRPNLYQLMSPPLPPAEPELGPELETAVGQELGALDSQGRNIDDEIDRNALAFFNQAAQAEAERIDAEEAQAPAEEAPVEPEGDPAPATGEAFIPADDAPSPEGAAPVLEDEEGGSADRAGADDGQVTAEQQAIDEEANNAATSPTNDLPEPTAAQADAGNYQKGHVTFDGLKVSIENPRGSVRRGIAEDGTEWETELQAHYGYVRGTEGADGDHVDMFIGPDLYGGKRVFIKDQLAPDGSFDEHKVLAGFDSLDDARAAYEGSYDEGAVPGGQITELTRDEFKEWIKNGDHKQPFAPIAESEAVQPEPEGEPEPEDAEPAPEQAADSEPQPEPESAGDVEGAAEAQTEAAEPVDDLPPAISVTPSIPLEQEKPGIARRRLAKKIELHRKLLDCVIG